MTNPTEQDRAEQVATDLERLAAFVRANPDIGARVAYLSEWQRYNLYLTPSGDVRTVIADIARRARRAGAAMRKDIGDTYAGADLIFGSLVLHVYSQREEVCERVVVGTRQVEVEEPDPKAVVEAVAALPKVKRVETVEDIEWRCTPLLAPADDADQAEEATAR